MAKSLITTVLSALRWAHWLVKCAVVYPLAMMMLLVVLVFRTGPYTFGQTLVKTVESVQQEGYVIQDCTGPKELNGDAVNAPLPPVLQEDCTTVSTDAAGYAAYIDQSYTHNILWLWLLMAVVFTGIAVVFRRTPVRRGSIRKPVPQSANYLDPKLYEELVRAANNLAEAVFRKTDWKSIFKK